MISGKVRNSASAKNSHEARNFPTMACQAVIGMVNSSSRVPCRRSSDHNRIPTAGTRKRNIHGCQMKKVTNDAWLNLKKGAPPTMKVKNPLNSKKITRKTYATADEK